MSFCTSKNIPPGSEKNLPFNIPGTNTINQSNSTTDGPSLNNSTDVNNNAPPSSKPSFLSRWGPNRIAAGSDYYRYKQIPACIANHLCLGSVFAWSLLNEPLMRHYGVVTSSSLDWSLGDVSFTFSLIMGGFAWGVFCGKYFETLGPRLCCLIGTASLGSGFGLAALAVETHNHWILYAGGLVWGMANGWAYVPPVATLIKWFPDRKGFASGMCLVGYGGGAMLAAPLITNLLAFFRVAPQYLGPVGSVDFVTQAGVLKARVAGELQQVVVATASEMHGMNLPEGVYVVGTGNTGLAQTLLTMGAIYSFTMAAASLVYRLPPAGYVPPHLKSMTGAVSNLSLHDVSLPNAMRSPQFWLMWTGFGFSITGAYAILGVAKTMVSEIFGSSMPTVMTPAACALFISAMSIANLVGRLVWPNLSDYLVRWKGGDPVYGRKLTFSIMFGMGPILYLGIVWGIHNSVVGMESIIPLGIFSGCVLTILSSFGGTSGTRPAFAADLFGNRNVGEITARSLSVVLPAAYIGPKLATHFREEAIIKAIHDLVSQISDETFRALFVDGKDQLDALIAQKTVTIARLLEALPPGTPDPTIYVYDKTMYVMAGLQALAFFSNLMITPVPVSMHMKKEKV